MCIASIEYSENTINRWSRTCILPSPLRLTERHFIVTVLATKKKEKPSTRCVVCSENKIRSETRYMCGDCNVGLCVVSCFK